MNTDNQSIKNAKGYIKDFWTYYDHAIKLCETDPNYPTMVFNMIAGMGVTLCQIEQSLGLDLT